MNMPPLPCHIQIAKTGTNTVRSLIDESFEKNNIYFFKFPQRQINGVAVTVNTPNEKIEQARATLKEKQWDLNIATMMLPVGIHTLLDRSVEYFSFVRDPVSRCQSALNFVYSRRSDHPNAAHYASTGWSLKNLIDSGEIFYQNDQVRMLSGSPKAEIGQEELDIAKQNILDKFYLIGAMESFSQCWPLLARRYELVNHANRYKNAGDYENGFSFSARDLDAAELANLFDTALYRWITQEYLPQMHGISPTLTLKVT
jgi:hypothetical protein